MPSSVPHDTPPATDWFPSARFGMFVHWGHSSQQGIELSWPLVGGFTAIPGAADIPVAQYHASASTFDPQAWDAPALARLAKRCGMQYAIFTAKHHDGYSMYGTQLSDFGVMHSPCGRDLFREFADAMRAEGIRVGVYYSLSDWHHPHYPPFTDAHKPYRFPAGVPANDDWPKYVEFMHGQVRELLTNYGRIDVIWFDGGWERTREQWRAAELEAMIRELQPGIMINDRMPGTGDYDTPEQFVPPKPPARPWEVCMTMNESWAYNPDDTRWKSSHRLIHTLCEVAARGGNLLLNVSPRGDGSLPPEQVERLEDIAGWMEHHRDAILGTQPALEPWQFYGPATRRGSTLYLHLLMRPYESVSVRGVKVRRVRSVRALGSGEDLRFERRITIIDRIIGGDPDGELIIDVPQSVIDPFATVIAVDVADAPVA